MDRFSDWVQRYRRAWESNDPEEIGALFTDDALYLTEPNARPWRGREEIVRKWLENKDEPGDTDFEFEIAMAGDDLAFVRGVTLYRSNGKDYDNLWEVTLDGEERCSRFVEWWIERQPAQD